MKEASTMKLRLVVVAIMMLLLTVSFTLFTPSRASAQVMPAGCSMSAATIDSLEMCVKHAEEQGHINSQDVAHTLLTKLDRAEDALEDGHTGTAIRWLKAFIHDVKIQSGKHIESMHAEHLMMHAEMVIQAIQQE
jgi:hypothetical protein